MNSNGGETLERLEAFGVGIGGQERLKMVFHLLGVGIPVAVHGGFLERPVHSFDLSVRPRVIGLGQAVLDAMSCAGAVKQMRKRPGLMWQVGELDAVIRQDGVDAVRDRLDALLQKVHRMRSRRPGVEPDKDQLGGPVHRHKQRVFPFSRRDLRNVDVKEPDGIGLGAHTDNHPAGARYDGGRPR